MSADKYPEDSDRRRFVKGVVGSATLAGVGTTGAAAINSATAPTGAGGGQTTYYAIENTDGPAPRGMPQVPIEIEDGVIKGRFPEAEEVTRNNRTFTVAEEQIRDVTYSPRWFQYCGLQTNAGIQPDADQDNIIRYTGSTQYDWQQEEVSSGEPVKVEHFSDYEEWGNGIGKSGLGKPADCVWRSQNVDSSETNPVQVLRSPVIEEAAQNNDWLAETTDQGFIAWMNKCTHFCCVPGFKKIAGSASFGAQDDVYCQCHQSIYDPFKVVKKTFTALPRPSE